MVDGAGAGHWHGPPSPPRSPQGGRQTGPQPAANAALRTGLPQPGLRGPGQSLGQTAAGPLAGSPPVPVHPLSVPKYLPQQCQLGEASARHPEEGAAGAGQQGSGGRRGLGVPGLSPLCPPVPAAAPLFLGASKHKPQTPGGLSAQGQGESRRHALPGPQAGHRCPGVHHSGLHYPISSGANRKQGGGRPSPRPEPGAAASEDQAAWLFGLTEVLCTVRAKHFKDRLALCPSVMAGRGQSFPGCSRQLGGGRHVESTNEGDRNRCGGGVKLVEPCHLLPSNKVVPCSALPAAFSSATLPAGNGPGLLLQGLPSPSSQARPSPHYHLAKFLLSL